MSKNTKIKSGIKILAADAKARLKNGYHNKNNQTVSIKSYFDIVKSSFDTKDICEKEKLFYDKVKDIISEGEVTNPLLRLVDKEYLSTLSYSAKQRYLLEISDKYNKIKKELTEEDKAPVT